MSNLDSPKMDSPKITPEELRSLSRAYPELGDKFRAAADEIERLNKILWPIPIAPFERMEVSKNHFDDMHKCNFDAPAKAATLGEKEAKLLRGDSND